MLVWDREQIHFFGRGCHLSSLIWVGMRVLVDPFFQNCPNFCCTWATSTEYLLPLMRERTQVMSLDALLVPNMLLTSSGCIKNNFSVNDSFTERLFFITLERQYQDSLTTSYYCSRLDLLGEGQWWSTEGKDRLGAQCGLAKAPVWLNQDNRTNVKDQTSYRERKGSTKSAGLTRKGQDFK